MCDVSTRRISVFWILPVLIFALSCFPKISTAMAQIQRTVPVTAQPDNSYHLYQTISRTFWNAEHQLQQRVDPFSASPSPYISPLDTFDPLYQKYFQVDQAANEYIQNLDNRQKILDGRQTSPFLKEAPQQKSPVSKLDNPKKSPLSKGDLGGFSGQSWTLPPVLYLGGIAAFTIGDYASAQKYFSRLLKNHADYKRYSYIGDNYTPNPDFAQPVKPAVTKLLFYCQISGHGVPAVENKNINHGSGVSPEKVLFSTGGTPEPQIKPSDSFLAFQQFNQTSLKVLSSQAAFADWLANRPYHSQRREFREDNYGDEPDQCRASVLPATAQLIEDGWKNLFPAALKKSGSLAMRTYLRTLTTDNSSLHDIAAPRLAEVDSLIIKSYFAQAKALLTKKDFAATRAKYKQILAEYPDSDASRLAAAELPKVVPVAVNYYKQVADASFHPEAKIGVPQGKALEYYQKMYNEDPDGPKADYALYYWARALGTAGKAKEETQLLQQFLQKFPKSSTRSKAMYLLGFTYIDHGLRDYQNGIPLLLQVAKDFPRSAEAPEALWNAAFVLGWNKQYQQAILLLQQLQKDFPKSPRAKYADQWIAKYKGGG